MSKLIFTLICLSAFGGAIPCQARVITVDDDGPADFNNIQAAIDDSNNDDTIIVADGVYKGVGNRDINFKGKAIVVRSENGPEKCIINCNGISHSYRKGFYFYNREDSNSIVDGFTITNSETAIWCDQTSPTIINCTIKNNINGIRCWQSKAIIANCLIVGNSGKCNCLIYPYCMPKGVGINCVESSPTITNCTIADNSIKYWEGGVLCNRSSPIITNSIIWGNSYSRDCIIDGNPHFPEGLCQIETLKGTKLEGNALVSYSNIQGGWSGKGNIDIEPFFALPGYWDPNGTPNDLNNDFWVDGDYHLKSQAGRWDANEGRWTKDEVTSLCIDAGDPKSPIGLGPFPNGGIINMGAYGGTEEASKSYFGEPVCETIVAGDINGDCKVDFKDFAFMAFHWLEDNNP